MLGRILLEILLALLAALAVETFWPVSSGIGEHGGHSVYVQIGTT